MAYLLTLYVVFVAYSWFSKYKENNDKKEIFLLIKRDAKVLVMVLIVMGIFKFVQLQDTQDLESFSLNSNVLYNQVRPYLIWILVPLIFVLILINNKIKK